MLVGGKHGGADGGSGVVGVRGREKFMSGLADTNAAKPVGAAILLEGCRVYLPPTALHVPEEILGSARAAAASARNPCSRCSSVSGKSAA